MVRILAVLMGTGLAALGIFFAYRWRLLEPAPRRAAGAGEWRDDGRDEVDLASDQSFPASDPPSWTGVTS